MIFGFRGLELVAEEKIGELITKNLAQKADMLPYYKEILDIVYQGATIEMFLWKSIAGMKNKGRWAFAPTEKGTEVTFLMDYELPASHLGKVLDKLFVERQNRKDISESLQRVKAILEG